MNKKKSVLIYFILGLICTGMAFFLVRNVGQPSKTVQSGKLQVVASFYPLYFFSQQIGGNKAEVTNIVPAGAEPHDYEPTAQDMAKMESSKLIVLNGGGLEAWSGNIKKNIDARNTAIVVAGEGLTTQQVTGDGQTGIDPHVWLDPPLAMKMVYRIEQGFEKVDPTQQGLLSI